MEENKQKCEICDQQIEGKPFALSSLSEPPRVLQVCESCATGPDVKIYHAGIQMVVDRDDFLRADKERLFFAVEEASCLLEEQGWDLAGVKLSARSDLATEPIDYD